MDSTYSVKKLGNKFQLSVKPLMEKNAIVGPIVKLVNRFCDYLVIIAHTQWKNWEIGSKDIWVFWGIFFHSYSGHHLAQRIVCT